ncbi:FAD:protein FMN transferase [Azospirillum sp. sgz301742]
MRIELTRRRFIAIAGAAALVPGSAVAFETVRWRGQALGAEASITLHHPDRAEAEALITACVDEVARLERVFSLYRRDSALSRLNRAGRLSAPPAELVALLDEARRVHDLSGGAFDVTVQPLWELFAHHFAKPDADPDGPAPDAVAAARALVDGRGVRTGADGIAFDRPGMAVTLNGIAQGFITDRVADRLSAAGIRNVLLDLGETRALGPRGDGLPWRVGIGDPNRPEGLLRTLEMSGRAVASSGGYGTVFDRLGRFHHLFDPATGLPARRWAGVSVLADTATAADALSTALCVAEPAHAADILRDGGGREAWLVAADGHVTQLSRS